MQGTARGFIRLNSNTFISLLQHSKARIKTFTGWTAQIIQHEIDHCDGILI